MTLANAVWHLLNALAAPFWVALLASGSAKLLWRREAAHCSWWKLCTWAYIPGFLAYLGLWAWEGAEGSIKAYACMVSTMGLALWWRLFVLSPR